MTDYSARSASDKRDNWPHWMVVKNNLNVTTELLPEGQGYMPFLPKAFAIALAALANDNPDRENFTAKELFNPKYLRIRVKAPTRRI